MISNRLGSSREKFKRNFLIGVVLNRTPISNDAKNLNEIWWSVHRPGKKLITHSKYIRNVALQKFQHNYCVCCVAYQHQNSLTDGQLYYDLQSMYERFEGETEVYVRMFVYRRKSIFIAIIWIGITECFAEMMEIEFWCLEVDSFVPSLVAFRRRKVFCMVNWNDEILPKSRKTGCSRSAITDFARWELS